MFNRQISAWWTVVAGFLGSAAGAGTIMVYSYGILSSAMGVEFGWSRDILAANMTSFLVGSGIGTVTLGWLISRYGIRVPSGVMAGLFGIFFASVIFLPPEPAAFVALFFLIGICGAACTAMPYAVAISGFFDSNRGLAIGIVVAGSGLGATLGPAITQTLVNGHSWRAGFALIGIGAAAISVAGIAFLVRTPPAVTIHSAKREPSYSITELYLANRHFWLIAIPILGVSIATFGGMASLVPLFKDHQISPVIIAGALSFAGLCSWLARIAVGYALDKVFAPYICTVVFTAAGAGLLLLTGVSGPVQAYAGAALVAMALGSEADLVSFLVSRYFRLVDYSRVLGVLWVVWAWGGGVGTSLAGKSFAQFGSYHPAFLLFVLLLVVGSIVICLIGPYRNPVHAQRATLAEEGDASARLA